MANTYTIQFRRGMYADFDTSKIRPGEPVAILGNDPSVPSGKALYIAFAANDVRRLCSIEDISEMVNAGEFVGPQGPKGDKGDKGADGTVTFESLTPEQKESLRGISIKSASVDTDGNLTITFSDGDSEDVGNIMGPQGIQGSKGDKGVGIKKITDYYALSSSNTDKAFGQVWLTTPPTMTAEKKYLWHWQRTDYTDDSFYSTEKGVIGVYGEQGLKGDKGDKGPKGDNMSDEQAAQIEQNKTDIASLKEDISTKITKFYASSQGKTHLADSDNGKIMDMMLYGKSEQKQYSGKNLLNPTFETDTYSGVALTNNGDGTYTIEGTNNSSGELIFPLVPTVDEQKALYNSLIGKNVKFITESGSTISGSVGRICFVFYNKTENRYSNEIYNGGNVTVPTGYDLSVVDIHINVGQTVPKTIIKPMITTDLTATYDDFEPYTGGIPSPNPDYPQEIKSVVNPTVKVCGKNLLKATLQTTTMNGVTCTANGDGTYTLNGTASDLTAFIVLKQTINTYTGEKLIGCPNGGSSGTYILLIVYYDKNQKWLSEQYDTGEGTIVKDFSHIDFQIIIKKGTVCNNLLFKPMITTDTSATYDDFEPYQEQTVTLPYDLYGVKVPSGGNVTIGGQQYVSDYFDVERGKLVRMCKEIEKVTSDVLKALSFSSSNESVKYAMCNGTLEIKEAYDAANVCYALCSHFKPIGWYSGNSGTIGVNIVNGDMRFYFGKNSLITTLESAKQFFEDNEVYISGVLKVPKEIDLTDEEVQALKALATYYPTTNISINSEQLDGYTVFNYPISIENGWNYVKQQIGDTRDYIYDMDARTQDTDLQAAEAYVNSEYAVALTELEV